MQRLNFNAPTIAINIYTLINSSWINSNILHGHLNANNNFPLCKNIRTRKSVALTSANVPSYAGLTLLVRSVL